MFELVRYLIGCYDLNHREACKPLALQQLFLGLLYLHRHVLNHIFAQAKGTFLISGSC